MKLQTIMGRLSMYWSYIVLVVAIGTAGLGVVAKVKAKAVMEYRKEQGDIEMERKVDRLILSDSLEATRQVELKLSISTLSDAVEKYTETTEALKSSFSKHLEKEKMYLDLLEFQKDLLNEFKKKEQMTPYPGSN